MRRVHPNVLLVEGKDELRAIPELMEAAGLSWPRGDEPVHIRDREGIENILAAGVLETELKASGLRALGIVVDADGDPAGRWEQLRKRLSAALPEFPESAPQYGVLLHTASGIDVGVWMMPDNLGKGMLESMLLGLRSDGLNDHVTTAVDEAKRLGASFKPAHRPKAELHTWLAWQDPPGLQVHLAIRAGLLKPDSEIVREFLGWFLLLFCCRRDD